MNNKNSENLNDGYLTKQQYFNIANKIIEKTLGTKVLCDDSETRMLELIVKELNNFNLDLLNEKQMRILIKDISGEICQIKYWKETIERIRGQNISGIFDIQYITLSEEVVTNLKTCTKNILTSQFEIIQKQKEFVAFGYIREKVEEDEKFLYEVPKDIKELTLEYYSSTKGDSCEKESEEEIRQEKLITSRKFWVGCATGVIGFGMAGYIGFEESGITGIAWSVFGLIVGAIIGYVIGGVVEKLNFSVLAQTSSDSCRFDQKCLSG